MTTNFYHS